MIQRLIGVLRDAGKATEVFESPDGSRALICPFGGRVLGLFTPDSDENFFWTNPALDSTESAAALYASGEWPNSGGDRTWLSPEIDLFFPRFPDLSAYVQPRALDPGDYRMVRTDAGVELINRLTVVFSRSRERLDLEIRKSLAPALNPLRLEREPCLAGLAYAGYTLRTSLEILGGGGDSVGIWNLLQMPHPGQLMVPTYARAQPKVYFGEIAPENLIVSDHLVRFRMRQTGEHKIGIRAVHTQGRVGYVYESGGSWSLVVRNFRVNPSGDYIDVPWEDADDFGYSVQACSVNSTLGRFNELEYHAPAIGGSTGERLSQDESQVWAFRGPKQAVQAVVSALLTPEVIDVVA